MNVVSVPPIRFAFNVPNMITTSRIVMAGVIAWLLFQATDATISAAAILLVVASLTDYFDGFFARRLGQASVFGSLFDVCTDQILFMPSLVLAVRAGLFDRTTGIMFLNPFPYVVMTLAGGVTIIAGVIIFLIKRRSRAMEFPTPTTVAKVNYWFWLIPLILAVFRVGPDLLLGILMYCALVSTALTFYSYLKKGSYVFTD